MPYLSKYMPESIEIEVNIMDFHKNWEKWGIKFQITNKSGEIGGFKSVGRKSEERVKLNPLGFPNPSQSSFEIL